MHMAMRVLWLPRDMRRDILNLPPLPDCVKVKEDWVTEVQLNQAPNNSPVIFCYGCGHACPFDTIDSLHTMSHLAYSPSNRWHCSCCKSRQLLKQQQELELQVRVFCPESVLGDLKWFAREAVGAPEAVVNPSLNQTIGAVWTRFKWSRNKHNAGPVYRQYKHVYIWLLRQLANDLLQAYLHTQRTATENKLAELLEDVESLKWLSSMRMRAACMRKSVAYDRL